MVRHRLLLIPAFIVVGAFLSTSPAHADVGEGCSDALASLGCPNISGSLSPSEAILGAIQPGIDAPEAEVIGNSSEDSADMPSAGSSPPVPPPPANCSPLNTALCAGEPAAPPEEPAAPVVVTLRDIASFRPATPGNTMEPGGWAVVGLPANFVAAASAQVVSGTLLGQPADVRFTPVGYRWRHSDGGLVESSVPGATWKALGQREFSVTSTSHAYASPGEYTVDLAVVLRAEYRFAGSAWRSIAGTLEVAGEPQRVLVGEFDTVLTRGDCNEVPRGPGC